MVLATPAKNTVSNGKPRMVHRPPRVLDHYQTLPAADTIHTHMKPIDYIGLYIIVIASCTIAVNWLYRIYL